MKILINEKVYFFFDMEFFLHLRQLASMIYLNWFLHDGQYLKQLISFISMTLNYYMK